MISLVYYFGIGKINYMILSPCVLRDIRPFLALFHIPYGPFTLTIFAVISSVIFSFWCMCTSRWVTNVRRTCTLTWTFITYSLVHIHQKKIAAKIASVNESLCVRTFSSSGIFLFRQLIDHVLLFFYWWFLFCRWDLAFEGFHWLISLLRRGLHEVSSEEKVSAQGMMETAK